MADKYILTKSGAEVDALLNQVVEHENILPTKQDLAISSPVTKTVGTGKDFETLHEALRWAEALQFSKGGVVTLTLDDGVHVLGGAGEFDSWNYAYYVFNNTNIRISSASGNKALCSITLDGYDDGDLWPYIIFATNGSNVQFRDVTINTSLNGYPYFGNETFIAVTAGTSMTFGGCNVTAGYGVYGWVLCTIGAYTTVFESCVYAINPSAPGCDVYVYSSTFSNTSQYAIYNGGGRVVLKNCTMVGNVNDYNRAINEIQPDGSYISDGTTDLLFSGLQTKLDTKYNSENIITSQVTKLVSAPGSRDPETPDFTSLHEALRWVETVSTKAGGSITLLLQDGFHELGGLGEANDWWWVFYILEDVSITIKSVSGIRSHCTITLGNYDDGDQWYGMFALNFGVFLHLENITIDTTSGGNPYPSHSDFVVGNGSVSTYNVDVKNCYNAFFLTKSANFLRNLTIDNCEYGFYLTGAKVASDNTTITNTTTAINVSRNSQTVLLGSVTLSGNTTDYNVPINEIQPDGSFVSDGSESLVGGGAFVEITEGYNTGVRLASADPANYGDIGPFAVDASTSTGPSDTAGATGPFAFAEGYNTESSGLMSHAEGYETRSTNQASHSEGGGTTASGYFSHAEGYETEATGGSSHAEGDGTIANGHGSHAEGTATISDGYSTHAEGQWTMAASPASHAENMGNVSAIPNSHAEGQGSVTADVLYSGKYFGSSGNSIFVDSADADKFLIGHIVVFLYLDGTDVHVIERTIVDKSSNQLTLNSEFPFGVFGRIINKTTMASSIKRTAHVEGYKNQSLGASAHAEGNATTALGDASHTEGIETYASGYASHAEGFDTYASDNASHAEGMGTHASAYATHAEGYLTTASGAYGSHAEGYYTTASGAYGSHAEGRQTVAAYPSQHVEGAYNTNKADTIHETGIGTSDVDRKNGFEVYNDGRVVAPELTPALHNTPRSLVTKEYLFSAEFGSSLPTADPLVVGKLWNNGGILTISAG